MAREDNAVPFGTKVDKAFFRGTLTGGVCSNESWRSMPRTKLVQVSRHLTPSTLNPEPGTQNSTALTINYKPYTMGSQT